LFNFDIRTKNKIPHNTMKKVIILLAFFAIFFEIAKSQERVYMPLFEVINMHPDYQYSTSKLFKTYVENNNKYLLIMPEKHDTLTPVEPIDVIKQKAAENQCSYFITGEFNRIGDVVIITISMYNTSDGKKIWHNTVKALTPDDIDPIMEKISANLGSNTVTDEGDIYNVTNYDSKELNKIGANRYFGISIGGGSSFVSNVKKDFPAGFGIMGSYDIRDFIFDVKAETYFSDVDVYYFNINAIYPLSTKKNSPFISGGLGYGGISITKQNTNNSSYQTTETNSSSGLLLFAGGGYIVNRNSDVSLRFSANLYTPFYNVGNDLPVGVLFSISLLFGR
jgi:hypothetical protein